MRRVGRKEVDCLFRIDRKGKYVQVTFNYLPASKLYNYYVRGTISEVKKELKDWIESNDFQSMEAYEYQCECATEHNYFGADYWNDNQIELDIESELIEKAIQNIDKLIKLGNIRKRVA